MNSPYVSENPCHPGGFVRRNVLEPRNLTVMAAASLLNVTRQTLSDFLNEKAGTHRTAGGGLDEKAGTISKVDAFVGKYVASRDFQDLAVEREVGCFLGCVVETKHRRFLEQNGCAYLTRMIKRALHPQHSPRRWPR